MEIRIATRKSPLALCQAEYVKGQLQTLHPKIKITLLKIQTTGDILLDTPLYTEGGKGLFIKQLEYALLDKSADIAVHSMKDVTIDLPDDLMLPVIIKRIDPSDVFISHTYPRLDALPKNAVIGTASQRRQAQLWIWRPDLNIINCRGNLNTRLNKLAKDEYDALILAAAGLKRLNLQKHIKEYLDKDRMLPAIGQGALGLECRAGDKTIQGLIAPLNDVTSSLCIQAERAFSRRLSGGCQLPIAAYAQIDHQQLSLTGLVAQPDGTKCIRDMEDGHMEQAQAIGTILAERLLKKGADRILENLK